MDWVMDMAPLEAKVMTSGWMYLYKIAVSSCRMRNDTTARGVEIEVSWHRERKVSTLFGDDDMDLGKRRGSTRGKKEARGPTGAIGVGHDEGLIVSNDACITGCTGLRTEVRIVEKP